MKCKHEFFYKLRGGSQGCSLALMNLCSDNLKTKEKMPLQLPIIANFYSFTFTFLLFCSDKSCNVPPPTQDDFIALHTDNGWTMSRGY